MTAVLPPQAVELRCPVGDPGRLFAKVLLSEDQPRVTSSNLLEVACQNCRRHLRGEGRTDVEFVLHRFDILGRLVETVIVAPVTDPAEYSREG
jgi:hypothetical protein